MVTEADDLGEGRGIVAGRFDAADFADGGHRALGLDDQADELDHAPAILDDAGGAYAPGQMAQAVRQGGFFTAEARRRRRVESWRVEG
jgi:hypothetical protein